MEPDFKIESQGIDAEALEKELARRVEARRRAGVYSPEVEARLAEKLPDEEDAAALPPVAALDYAATRALASWEVGTAYPVETEKRFPRALIILAKRAARLWARIAVGPIQREQTAFNRQAAGALDALKRHAIEERAAALAAEADLASLAESMISPGEARNMGLAVVESLEEERAVTVVGPCPVGLLESLARAGREVYVVRAGSAWDASAGDSTRSGPLSFLTQVSEGSLGTILVCELAFWLSPASLIGLARRSYLALGSGGKIILTVHSFTASSPAPSWCAPSVLARALELAGFERIEVVELDRQGSEGPSGCVVTGRKA